ncbi:MAG: hypothetical protein JNL79_00575 [Myxococcales bacterium]|nr:hypothetical protein [Myxococcales bacterium]
MGRFDRAAVPCLGLTALALMGPASARADEDRSLTAVVPGYLHTWSTGRRTWTDRGAELSVVHAPYGLERWQGFGLLGQLQRHDEGIRAAVAAEVFYSAFGLEAGWAVRTSADGAQHGLHLAPFFSVGFLSVALRTTFALGSGSGTGNEVGLALGLKLPIPVQGWRGIYIPGRNIVGGRPLRGPAGEPLLPSACDGRRRGEAHDSRRWIEQARLEQASIDSFLWLADDLDAHGAPAPLVERALAAAAEEREHARVSLGFAGRDARLAAAPRRRGTRRRPTLQQLYEEAVLDGVLGEGRAAIALADEARRQPLRAAALARMAAEEASHAVLSVAVAAFVATHPSAGFPVA